jgi:hypothetical protein
LVAVLAGAGPDTEAYHGLWEGGEAVRC